MLNLWLDLELREDIDDYVTLLYSLENYNVSVISIHNPSNKELALLKNTLSDYNKTVPIIITGDVVEQYPDGKDINPYFLDNKLLKNINYDFVFNFDEFIENYNINGVTVFCGGSLKTLSLLTERFDVSTFKAFVQGGFASYEIVAADKVLKKFKKRKAVPTWNLNLDLEATNVVLNSGLKVNFVSKNICHSAFVSLDDVKGSNNSVCAFLTDYFNANTRFKDKCLHDVLALLSIDNDIVEFKPVTLFHTDDERPKWWSELNNSSDHKISVDYDYELFLNKIIE